MSIESCCTKALQFTRVALTGDPERFAALSTKKKAGIVALRVIGAIAIVAGVVAVFWLPIKAIMFTATHINAENLGAAAKILVFWGKGFGVVTQFCASLARTHNGISSALFVGGVGYGLLSLPVLIFAAPGVGLAVAGAGMIYASENLASDARAYQ